MTKWKGKTNNSRPKMQHHSMAEVIIETPAAAGINSNLIRSITAFVSAASCRPVRRFLTTLVSSQKPSATTATRWTFCF